MLLRRYMENISSQNWTAVFLDFVIVVFGLFIGLQVDAWNEQRKDAAREADYLEQLHVDFSKNIDELNWLLEWHDELASELMYAIGQLKDNDPIEDEDRVKWAVLRMYQIPPQTLNMASYEAMVAAGDFSIIRDRDLRSLLVSIDSGINAEQSTFWRKEDRGGQFPDAVWHQIARAVAHPSGKGISLEVDYEALRAYEGTLWNLSMQRRTHAMVAAARADLLGLFQQALALIEKSMAHREELTSGQ